MGRNFKLFLFAFFVAFFGVFALNVFQKNLENYFYAQVSQPIQEIAKVNFPKQPEKPDLEIQAKSAISVRVNERERILFKKEIDQPLPIASLTKLMTAVIVLENPENYDLKNTWITVSETAANQGNAPNHSNLKWGEKFNIEEILGFVLVYSSNDAAYALSEVIGTENFVEQMNQKAKDLELNNTHFTNPTGLDPEDLTYNPADLNYFNYSTTEDLVKIAQYILRKHPLIFEISIQERSEKIENGIFDLFLTQEVIGGKTGFTKEAGGCILFVFKDEKENLFINVVLDTELEEARITEMQKLIDYASASEAWR